MHEAFATERITPFAYFVGRFGQKSRQQHAQQVWLSWIMMCLSLYRMLAAEHLRMFFVPK